MSWKKVPLFALTLSLVGLMAAAVISCASSQGPWYMSDGESGNQAPGAAYAGEGMMFRKPMPHQDEVKPWQFYYKHCSNDNGIFYSKTDYYSCTPPY